VSSAARRAACCSSARSPRAGWPSGNASSAKAAKDAGPRREDHAVAVEHRHLGLGRHRKRVHLPLQDS
jgi:hypothetical protein